MTESAFNKGIRTWPCWIIRHLDATKTTIVFSGISPQHQCYNKTQPIMVKSYVCISWPSKRNYWENNWKHDDTSEIPEQYQAINSIEAMHIQLCMQESSTSFWKLICNSKNKGSSGHMEQALACILGLGHYNFLTFGCLTLSKSCDVPWFIIIRSVNLLLVCTIFISCLQSSTYPSEL